MSFIKSFFSFSLNIGSVENLPSLIGTVVWVPGKYIGTFSIFAVINIKTFLVLDIADLFSFILE